MFRATTLCTLLAQLAFATAALGHGLPLVLNTNMGAPVSMTAVSDAPFLIYNTAPPAGYNNMFLGRLAAATSTDETLFPGGGPSYLSTSGFAEASGTWLPFSSATYSIISPLYFSGGGPAVPATPGTHLDTANRFGGNSDGNHPGAVAGGVSITGTSGLLASPAVSMADSHELAFRLFLAPGSTQTFGAYGFAYTVTVNFDGFGPLTSGPLAVVFQMRDPTIAGGMNFNDPANSALQLASSQALYGALVPEPSSVALAGVGIVSLAALGWRRCRGRLRA